MVHASENDLEQVIGILGLHLLHGKFQPIWCWLVTRIDIGFFFISISKLIFYLEPSNLLVGHLGSEVQQTTRARRRGFVVWVVPGVLKRKAEAAVVKASMALAEWASRFRWV